MSDFVTALLYWPVLTYFIVAAFTLTAGAYLWRIDDEVRYYRVVVLAFAWPLFAPRLFQ